MLGIISWHCLVRFWSVLATPAHCLGVTKLALRVFPAVPRLTVHRWLQMPESNTVRIVFAQRRIRDYVCGRATFDRSRRNALPR